MAQEMVLRKLIGLIRRKGYTGGKIIVHFTNTGKTYFWDVDALK
jgi:hypothetical protein